MIPMLSSGGALGKARKNAAQLAARIAGAAPALRLAGEHRSGTAEKFGDCGRNSSVIDGARNDLV